jgi:hypothetical protein
LCIKKVELAIFKNCLFSIFVVLLINICLKMKKLLLSVAILVVATLILSQDNSEELKSGSQDNVVNIESKLQSQS